jgi:hypothetical protein
MFSWLYKAPEVKEILHCV